MTEKARITVPAERIEKSILVIRKQKVMLDADLAGLYGVETRRLNEQVRRNIRRFPKDFMFQLTREEFDNLKSQIATSSEDIMDCVSMSTEGMRHGKRLS